MPTDEVRDRRLAYALDASALLAMLMEEPGGEMVDALLEHSIMSTVNWSEVAQKATANGAEVEGLGDDLAALGLAILPFTEEDANIAAAMWSETRKAGLSLADRACLALAQRYGVPALSCDRAWKVLNLEVEVELLR